MSHSQEDGLTVNVNGILNKKTHICKSVVDKSAMRKGSTGLNSVESNIVDLEASSIHNEFHCACVSVSPTPANRELLNVKSSTAPNSTVKCGLPSSGPLINFIPLQISNTPATPTASISDVFHQGQAFSNEVHLKMNVGVNSKGNSINYRTGDNTDITKAIGSSFSNKNCGSIPIASINMQQNVYCTIDLGNAASPFLEPTNHHGSIGSSRLFIKQVPKLNPNLQGTSISPLGTLKMSASGDMKATSNFDGNETHCGKVSKNNRGRTNSSLQTDANEIQNELSLVKGMTNDSNNTAHSAMKKLFDKNSSPLQNKPNNYEKFDGDTINSMPENVFVPSYAAADISQNMLDSTLTETNKEKIGSERILKDSIDDEMQENTSFVRQNVSKNVLSTVQFAHITNSVVFTQAKSANNRSKDGLRVFSTEPANVVLMKIPKTSQKEIDISDSRIEENPALIFSSEIAKTKSVPIFTRESNANSRPSVHCSSLLLRSSSIPNEFKTLLPRAEKRSQSLNCIEQPKVVTISKLGVPENQPTEIQTLQTSECTPSTSSNSNLVIEQIETRDLLSLDEISNQSSQVPLIDLEDSLPDDFPEDSKAPMSKISNVHKIDQQEKTQNHYVEDGSRELFVGQRTKKGLNSIIKKISSNSHYRDVKAFQKTCRNSHLQSMVFEMEKLGDNAKNDKSIKTLPCNENAMNVSSPSSSASFQLGSSTDSDSKHFSNTRAPLTPRSREHYKVIDASASNARRLCRDSSIASALSMVSSFDMLHWKEDRIASARGTTLRFELNEFNLLQIHERGCPPRYRIHTPYEKPIYERFPSLPKLDQTDPLLYLCRKCKLYGPAVDFLAPEFCSAECLKRTLGKRCSRDVDVNDRIDKKRSRGIVPNSFACKPIPNSKTSNVVPIFRWSTYLSSKRNATAAPIDLFFNPFPIGPNHFSVGMKIEAIDTENCSLFCVCTIVQIQGYRMRLSFDGYDSCYDFWVNADSMDIFPPGWCERTNRILQPPRGFEVCNFQWHTYLLKTNSVGADESFFTHLSSTSITNRNPFTVGMFLEADDLNDTGKLCVASIADVLDERIRVHFDGWDDCYDYWIDIHSPYIHPCGWHEGRQQLLVPPEYSNTSFNWRDYIRENEGLAAPTDFFVPRDPVDYRPSMKLEVVDPKNSSLIRPSSIVHRSRHRIKIHFDGWPPEYYFFLEDDSPDLHPIGWCDATGHELEPPPGFLHPSVVMPCETIGCRGIGNIDRTKGLTHANRECCPYMIENWRSKPKKLQRIDGKDIVRKIRLEPRSTELSLENSKSQNCQSVKTSEKQQPTETPINLPPKQPRGRPRNCDRLVAAAVAAASALQKEKPKKDLSTLHSKDLKVDLEEEIYNKDIRKLSYIQKTQKSIVLPAILEKNTQLLREPPHIKNLKRFLCDYGPRLKQNYVLWCQNEDNDISSKVQSNPLLWSTAETCAFIDSILSELKSDRAKSVVSSKFIKHDIDGCALLMLQQQDLTEVLDFKMGMAIKLCSIILQLRMVFVSNYGKNRPKIEEGYVQN